MTDLDPPLLIEVDTREFSMADRHRLAGVVFGFAKEAGVDEVRLQQGVFEPAPPVAAGTIAALVEAGRKKRGWVTIAPPSGYLLDAALLAAPYVFAVNLFRQGDFVAATSDAIDSITIVIPKSAWPAKRAEMEIQIGKPLRYDQLETNIAKS